MKENLPVSLQKLIHKVEETFAEDPAMVELFINCFSNTLDTTVKSALSGSSKSRKHSLASSSLVCCWISSGCPSSRVKVIS